ncbi:uncharacterized protein IL334_006047 [Kwoniella shivajii]|uniref:Major facilitator superfamily (MFS) profile domain-containing protein n=1 Tax=Kwoniella shivajii TaxID=564305 RepID=A0ABZ1D6W8_9TREE|nr:hypothetical protein IL334_006047 [Kwoniella shivajii]
MGRATSLTDEEKTEPDVIAAVDDNKQVNTLPKLRKEISIQDQSSRMPLRKILIVYAGIGTALVVSFMDQTAVSTAAPNIGIDLNGSASIAWLGTSFFVANCAFQLVYGRLSDIFGRKNMLQLALVLLAVGNLMCSFASSPIQLYTFRAISGIGGGGINNIAMVIVSDIVPLKERGKYQGLISASTSLGSAIGPFLGGGLAGANNWRWLFRITTICGVLTMVLIHFIIPLKPVFGSMRKKLLQVDYFGVFLSSASIIFLLVPISGGGSTFAWSNPTVIALLVCGGLCAVLFVLVEWKLAKLPILPLRLFRMRTPTIVNIQSFFIGMIYFGNIFYIPMFLQYVKGYSPLLSGAFVLVYTLPQAGWGIGAGLYISKTNHYKRIIVLGAAIWTLALGLQLLWKPDSSLGLILGILEIGSVGVGFSLQTTVVAALATSPPKDRAVITASRNFFRSMGGSFGLACASAIYQAVIKNHFARIDALTESQQSRLLDSGLSHLPPLPAPVLIEVRDAYSDALRMVFAAFTAFSGVALFLSLLIQEVEFMKDQPQVEERTSIGRLATNERERFSGTNAEADKRLPETPTQLTAAPWNQSSVSNVSTEVDSVLMTAGQSEETFSDAKKRESHHEIVEKVT